ncbi:MAG: hypothetical protein P4M14_01425 [Gammaproteobacteria bacterium]|nr:hypothetical protein [Gammaproteobacteria bacterium]
MWDVVGSTLSIFFLFSLIGLGPALLLFKNKTEFALATAPTIGVVLTTLIGTYLVSADYPIASFAWGWLLTGIAASALMTIYHLKNRNKDVQSSLTPFSLGLVVCAILILAPVLVGGLNFTVLRGNGTDTFNYILMSGYLIHEPLSWVHTASIQSMVDKQPIYSLAYNLFTKTRWSTSMLMGWGSFITHTPLYRFEYGFTALFSILAYGCAYCFASILQIRPRYALLVALAIAVGFWGQFVLDIRAMSQISTLPILLFLALLIGLTKKEEPWVLGRVFLGLSFASIAMLYIELLPTIFLGFFLFLSLQWLTHKETVVSIIKQYWLPLVIAIIAMLPLCYYLAKLLASQLQFAASIKNTWEDAYFHWLYKKTALGYWGFSIINHSNHAAFDLILSPLKPVIDFLSAFLTGLLIYLMAATIFTKNKKIPPALTISVTLLLATLCEWAYLYAHEQYWAAGKSISFGYPFIFFIVASVFSSTQLISNKILLKVCQYSVLCWIVIQCGLGFYRISAAKDHVLYSNYISNHGEYQRHHWKISHIEKAIKNRHIAALGLDVADPWVTEYLSLVFGWDIHVTNVNGVIDRANYLSPKPSTVSMPDYFIVTTQNPVWSHAEIVAQDSEFVLIKTSPALLNQLAHQNS